MCQASKHEHKNYSCKDRLDEEPDWTKDSLLIKSHNISLNIHFQQVTILPDLFQIETKKFALGLDNQVPVFIGC
jgi:hypothetical protein